MRIRFLKIVMLTAFLSEFRMGRIRTVPTSNDSPGQSMISAAREIPTPNNGPRQRPQVNRRPSMANGTAAGTISISRGFPRIPRR